MNKRGDSFEHKSEKTAVLSILKEQVTPEHTEYSILLSFVGSVLLPPYLPRIKGRGGKADRRRIGRALSEIVERYDEFYFDHDLAHDEAQTITDDLEEVGSAIAAYLRGFKRALDIIVDKDIDVKNLIIQTDEPAIPWSLAFCDIWKDEPYFDFICNRYSCGTILVDDRPDAYARMKDYTLPGLQPDEERLGHRNICLIAAPLEDETIDPGINLSEAYVNRLHHYFSRSPLSHMSVKCITAKDWQDTGGRPERMIAFLNEELQKAQIIHFTGHVVDGKLRFDKNTFIGPENLKHLKFLSSKPLVVLHGCSSGRLFDINKEEAQLCQVFLDRGASGCLATILPVNIPRHLGQGAETLIELFYQNVLQLKPYGHALRDARNAFRRRSLSKNDPQALFYQLFGDPRAKLVTEKLTTPDLLEIDENEEGITPSKAEPLVITLEGFSFEDQELREMLSEVAAIKEIAAIKKIERQSSAVSLGLNALADPAVGVAVQVFASIGVAPITTVLAERLYLYFEEARQKRQAQKRIDPPAAGATDTPKAGRQSKRRKRVTRRFVIEWGAFKYSKETEEFV